MRPVHFKTKNQFRILLLIVLFTLTIFSGSIHAQVTIGSGEPPVMGALLDLKEYDLTSPHSENGTTATKGLNLSRVKLVALDKLFPMFDDLKDVNTYRKSGVEYPKNTEDAKHVGLMVYNLKEDPSNGFVEGIYYWNGQKWTMLTESNPASKFFYMPSFVLDTSAPYNVDKTVDLYEAYSKQFTGISGNRRNPSSKENIPIYGAQKLDYYITDFDNSVMEIRSISDQGVLTYRIKAVTTGITYINVVFVVK